MNDAHSGNCSLSISFLLPDEDYGTYTCIASNVKGQVSTEASLLDEGSYIGLKFFKRRFLQLQPFCSIFRDLLIYIRNFWRPPSWPPTQKQADNTLS